MKKFYITTSIAYTNASPHIGFALELVQADVIARYSRLLGKDVFSLTGTDEHGIKIAKAAKEAGKEPKEFMDELAEEFKQLSQVLNISNDDFIRTSDKKRHWPAVKKLWLKLKKEKDIYKKQYEGLYCIGCEAFIVKRDLRKGKCIVHQKKPEKISEENYFFKLSEYSNKIKEAIEKNIIKIIPESRKKEILNFIKQRLEDISFSRPSKDLKWGISVPNDNSQTIYVRADALFNYLSAIGYPDKKYKQFWPADIHFIGKDILKFHALIWPGMLLALGLPLPKTIFVHGFITSGGQKMSKSLGNVVDPFELVEKYGTDAVRYFLLAEIPATEDGDFTIKRFEERYNSDLASGIGNLVARVRVMAENCKLQIANCKLSLEVKKEITKTKGEYKKTLEEFKFNETLKTIWGLISFCDKYINEERPWDNQTEKQRKKNRKVINDLLIALEEIAKLLLPFLPETAERILKEIERDKKTGEFARERGKAIFPQI